jgi:hypothetical protein
MLQMLKKMEEFHFAGKCELQNKGCQKNLPEDIIEAFEKPVSVKIPKDLMLTHSKSAKTDWNQHQYATIVVILWFYLAYFLLYL